MRKGGRPTPTSGSEGVRPSTELEASQQWDFWLVYHRRILRVDLYTRVGYTHACMGLRSGVGLYLGVGLYCGLIIRVGSYFGGLILRSGLILRGGLILWT